jgi:hypothetical protein
MLFEAVAIAIGIGAANLSRTLSSEPERTIPPRHENGSRFQCADGTPHSFPEFASVANGLGMDCSKCGYHDWTRYY